MEKQLVKVILEYDDGSKRYIDGDDIKKWKKANEACVSLYHAHFGKTGYETIKFKDYKDERK